MTKQMAESLGMNDLDRVKKALQILHEKENEEKEDFSEEEFNTAIQEYQSLNDTLIALHDPVFDQEMDEIAKDAEEASKELLELGMNVETKYTAEIVSAAERFKATQLAAKKAKAHRKIQMLDLKLKERRLDLLEEKQRFILNKDVIPGDGEEISDFDRDEILDSDKN